MPLLVEASGMPKSMLDGVLKIKISKGGWSEPKPIVSTPTMHGNRGTARLTLQSNEAFEKLLGDYYSRRDRQNLGSMTFKRLQ